MAFSGLGAVQRCLPQRPLETDHTSSSYLILLLLITNLFNILMRNFFLVCVDWKVTVNEIVSYVSLFFSRMTPQKAQQGRYYYYYYLKTHIQHWWKESPVSALCNSHYRWSCRFVRHPQDRGENRKHPLITPAIIHRGTLRLFYNTNKVWHYCLISKQRY